MNRTLEYLLLTGIAISLILIFSGYPEAGAMALILTPLCRNFVYAFFALFERTYLFAIFAIFTVAIILFT